jgi:hypothetical protein
LPSDNPRCFRPAESLNTFFQNIGQHGLAERQPGNDLFQLCALKHSDETDARYLVHLLRLGILTGTIPPPEARNLRDLARKHMQLVPSRTAHILAVENITAR